MVGNIHRVRTSSPGAPITVDDGVLPASAADPGRMGVTRFTVAVGAASVPERHESHELWLVEAGRGEVAYDGDRFTVGPGAMVYVEPWHEHGVRNVGDEPLAIFSVWWKR